MWHLWHWAGSGGALGFRCGADVAAVGVAGVAFADIHLRFMWQVWYLIISIGHVPLLYYLYFCVYCDIFGADKIIIPVLFVIIWHHIYMHPYIYPSIHPFIHPSIHTCIHTCIHYNLSIYNLLVLTLPHTHNLLHTNPLPSLFPFLLSPCHLYLSFAACWKKLTCEVIRFFNFDNYI